MKSPRWSATVKAGIPKTGFSVYKFVSTSRPGTQIMLKSFYFNIMPGCYLKVSNKHYEDKNEGK